MTSNSRQLRARIVLGFLFLGLTACARNQELPDEGKQCLELIAFLDDYLLKNNRLPLKSDLGENFADLADRCDYRRDFDGWSMSLHGQKENRKTCSDLFHKLNEYSKKHESLPDNLAEIDPSIPNLMPACNITRGGEKTYSLQISGGASCSMDLTGGCSASDCRTSWQKVLDSLGIIRPPVGKSRWSYSSRLGKKWTMSCGDIKLIY